MDTRFRRFCGFVFIGERRKETMRPRVRDGYRDRVQPFIL